MVDSIFYYFFYSSAVLLYGIGLKRTVIPAATTGHWMLSYFKVLISTSFSGFICWLITRYLLVPVRMTELMPFICVLIVLAFSVFFEALIRITAKTSTAEISVSLLSVILAVNESSSMLEATFFSACCISAFFLYTPVLSTIQKRISFSGHSRYFKSGSLLFITVAVILIVLFSWDVSWLHTGVVK